MTDRRESGRWEGDNDDIYRSSVLTNETRKNTNVSGQREMLELELRSSTISASLYDLDTTTHGQVLER